MPNNASIYRLARERVASGKLDAVDMGIVAYLEQADDGASGPEIAARFGIGLHVAQARLSALWCHHAIGRSGCGKHTRWTRFGDDERVERVMYERQYRDAEERGILKRFLRNRKRDEPIDNPVQRIVSALECEPMRKPGPASVWELA